MMLRLLLAGCAIGLLVLVACGDGDDDRVLELSGYDITESDYRAYIRSVFLSPLAGASCAGLTGLSVDDAMAAFRADAASDEGPTQTPPPAAILKPDQAVNEDDAEIAVAIILEECERVRG